MRRFQIVVHAIPNFIAIKGSDIAATGVSGEIYADDISHLRYQLKDFLGNVLPNPRPDLRMQGIPAYLEDLSMQLLGFPDILTLWENPNIQVGEDTSPYMIKLTELPLPGTVEQLMDS